MALRTPVSRRRMGGVVLATVLAIALGVTPPAAQPALAADNLRLQADAVYTLDPDAGRVHVKIDVRATDLKPNSPSIIYYYASIGLALQPEATAIRATDRSGAISISTRKRAGFIEGIVRLRSNLYYRDSATFTIRYDLVGGAPRSDSPVRVGRAFAAFGVWSWGDAGRSTVEVRTPPGFDNEVAGGPLQASKGTAGEILKAEPEDPETFFAIVTSENRAAYEETRLSFEGGVEIVVKAWPEDDEWDEIVGTTLRRGIPELRDLIGLAWPVAHDLNVRERYTPALEGYAGVFFTEDQRIDVSEDLDPLVILHEASHAWFNDGLFTERWIYEGLAEEYAWRVQTAIGGDPGAGAELPDVGDPGHLVLVGWTFPQVIRDQKTDDRERYGYGAAFWVMHQIVTSAGVDGMREAFAAADTGRTAYPGAGTPETTGAANDWRRLLDLVQPLDEEDSAAVEATLRAFAISEIDGQGLTNRAPARARYRALLTAGAGWLPPWAVRKHLDTWAFVGATKAMERATAVLDLRDRVQAAATALGLQPDDALKAAYEGAQNGFEDATAIATAQLAALAALEDARATVEATPDFVAQIGLMGETPRVPYDAARAAFEAGDMDLVLASSAATVAIITGATAVGQQRLLVAAGSTIGVLLVLFLLVVVLRRRGRRRALALVGALATAQAPIAVEGGLASAEPYAMLAADPGAAAPPTSASPPDDEGGHERGDSPADP